MKSNTQKYFESMQLKSFQGNVPVTNATNLSDLHTMSVREPAFKNTNFEERVYLENEAFSQFCDFLSKE